MPSILRFVARVSFVATLVVALLQWPAVAAAKPMSELRKISSVTKLPGAPAILYSAARGGLYRSIDAGKTWQLSYKTALPVTMLTATDNDKLYAFVVTKGLLIWDAAAGKWNELGNQFGSQVLTHIVSETQSNALLATNQFGQMIRSVDGGTIWRRTAGIRPPQTRSEKRGQKLFNANCQSCHGKQGVGEAYTLESLTDKKFIMAPPLNDFGHAWHHTDTGLAKTILEGTPRKSRMIAWKELLQPEDAKDIVSYIKTLWGKWTLDCQGPKHMQCM